MKSQQRELDKNYKTGMSSVSQIKQRLDVNDPVKLLQSYFTRKEEAKSTVQFKDAPIKVDKKSLVIGAAHKNHIVSKYRKQLKTGQLKNPLEPDLTNEKI